MGGQVRRREGVQTGVGGVGQLGGRADLSWAGPHFDVMARVSWHIGHSAPWPSIPGRWAGQAYSQRPRRESGDR